MVGGSTMATAICSRCLKYVLMKKSNPTCPRCSNPVILDSSSNGAAISAAASLLPQASKKRPNSLELSPDDLSLSTDSSR
jgi:ribosomal protein S27AE